MKALGFFMFFSWGLTLISPAQTDVSLYYKKGDQTPLEFVESKRGNLFYKLGHHGPAIENPWYALRLYFDKKAAIDVYSKAKAGLELKEMKWYPTVEQQRSGWGSDYYKVGKTVGLGGIKLWADGEILQLHPVTKRTAKVFNYADSAAMEMISYGVTYGKRKVDILVRVTVYDTNRKARVMARSINGESLQFVTGINYFDNLEIIQTDDYIATWGFHPEDIPADKTEVGAALFIPTHSNFEIQQTDDQFILISDKRQSVSFEITTASAREANYKSMADFIGLVESLIE